MNETKPTLLVIEDEALLLKSITAKLEKNGFHVVAAGKGEEAIDYLESHPDKKPDLIWLDYYLAGKLNGIDFLEEKKRHEEWNAIPVIAVSNTATEAKVQKMLDLGAVKYFMKAQYLLSDIIEFIWSVINKEK